MELLRLCEGADAIVGTLESHVRSGHFTAWSAACRDWQASAFFADEWCPRDLATPHPTFDLASLTKPLFVPLLLKLEGLSAQEWAAPRENLKGRSLLDCADHLSGAPAWFWMGRASWVFKGDAPRVSQAQHEAKSLEDTRARVSAFLTQAALDTLDDAKRGQTLYSDLNAFLLARAYEALHAHEPLGPRDLWISRLKVLNERVGAQFQHASLLSRPAGPFGVQTVPFAPYVSVEDEAGGTSEATGFDAFGPVHDTNANLLATRLGGVVSGHAGLLGSVADVDAALPHLAMGHDALVRDLGLLGHLPSRRFVLSLDTPSGATSLAGLRNFPPPGPGSILGHLGFTGTSFWMRQHEGIVSESHVLLTNRVAHRAQYGSQVPRILVLTSRDGAWRGGAVAKPGGGWQSLSEDDFRALAREHARARRLLWDSSLLRFPPDIADVRRTFGRLAWDL